MKHVYVHTYTFGPPYPGTVGANPNPWRVYEGLELNKTDKESLIAFLDETNAIRTEKIEHIGSRHSAAYFVYANEFDRLYRDIQEDWNKRQCWRECWDDAKRIKAERAAIVEVCTSCGAITGGGNICVACAYDAGNFE